MPTDPPHSQNPRPLERASTFQSLKASINDVATSLSQTTRDAINADVPLGAWAAAAEASSKAPTLGEIRKGSFADNGWVNVADRRAGNRNERYVPAFTETPAAEGNQRYDVKESRGEDSQSHGATRNDAQPESDDSRTLIAVASGTSASASAYEPPAKVSWTKSTIIGLRAFWKWFCTPFGFLVTIYALNVVAWGGMLFLLLCKAAPAMCWALDDQEGWIRDCDHLYSARRIWMEIDSQILNALFCVTAFGLIPWRFRDLYYLLRWRLLPQRMYGRHQKLYGLRTLGGIYVGWARLPGSDTLDSLTLEEYNAATFPSGTPELTKLEFNLPSVKANALDPRVPWQLYKTPTPPPTGVRAPPTALWKIDLFVWCNVWNTFFQVCLCGFMWGMSRFDRPSWSTGLFIALACIVSGISGIMSFIEGKKIKQIEGVRLDVPETKQYSRLRLDKV
ncbi:hypothetical protein Q7P37_003789 [Cladosporium fusiforme]